MSIVPFVEIDLAALARNFRLIEAAAVPSATAAVVKANAYGLGIGPVARCLAAAGCRHFFVATLDEGVELRALLSEPKIYVLDGPLDGDCSVFSGHRLIPVLNSIGQIRHWGAAGPAALHLDTGMNRLGLAAGDLAALPAALPGFPAFGIDLVMTHLACADEPEHPLNASQVARFERARAALPPAPTSIGNSAGALLGPAYRGDLVRAGIGLYGGNPFSVRPSPVEPVASLRAPIIQVRTIDEDAATLGYGASFAATPGARIATVGLGYADGYPRTLSNAGVASVGGTRVPVVGRVSMDLVCIDVSAVPAADLGDGAIAEFFGSDLSIDEVAVAAGTISYELLTGLGRRVERRYVGGQDTSEMGAGSD